MLPAHAPELKKTHTCDHFGTAWQNQHKGIEFPGGALHDQPLDSYQDRVFTNGLVGWPGCPHIAGKDFAR
jgi:hydroxylamine reductase